MPHAAFRSCPRIRALGCLDPQCALCLHNPCRRCTVNFDRKYLVSDQLKARCGAPIRMELVDRITGQIVEESVPELKLEVRGRDGDGGVGGGEARGNDGSDADVVAHSTAMGLRHVYEHGAPGD